MIKTPSILLEEHVHTSKLGLQVKLDLSSEEVAPVYLLFDSIGRLVYKGNYHEIWAFISGCKYLYNLYEC